MAVFYCVGFPDLDRAWNFHGHVQNHEVYTNKADAEKANEGKVTMVHEFYVRDALFDVTISRLRDMRKRFIDSRKN